MLVGGSCSVMNGMYVYVYGHEKCVSWHLISVQLSVVHPGN